MAIKGSDSIGRAFLEIGADRSNLVSEIDAAVKALDTGAAKSEAAAKKLGASFERALDPTKNLEKDLVALGKTGRTSADIVKVYGDRILQASAIAERHGQTLTPIVSQYRQLATAQQTSTGSAISMAGSMARGTEQLQEARWASMLLTRQLGIQLPEAMQGFIAKYSGMGNLLSGAFKAVAWGSLAIAIYEAGKRLVEWAANSEEAAKQTKELTEEVEKQQKIFEKYVDNIEKARRAGSMIGLSGTAKTEAQQAFKREDLDRARVELDALSGRFNRLYIDSQKTDALGRSTKEAVEAAKAINAVQDQMREAENRYRVLQIEVANGEREIALIKKEAAEDAKAENIGYERRMEILLDDTNAWTKILDAVADRWHKIEYGIEDVTEKQKKLMQDLRATPGRSAISLDQSGVTDYGKLLGPSTAGMKFQEAMIEEQRKAAERSVQIWADAAGEVFDSVLARGRGFWDSMMGLAEAIFLTPLRVRFQKMMVDLFAGSKLGTAMAGTGGFSTPGFSGGWPSFGGGGGGGGGGYTTVFDEASGGFITSGGGSAGSSFMKGAGGQALLAGGMMAGTAMMSDAWKRGSKLEGLAGGAIAGASVGFQVGGPIGAGIGAAIGAAAGFFVGMFGGGEKRREMERQRRLDVQSAYYSDTPGSISRSGLFGASGDFDIETDLTGRVMATRRAPIIIQVEAMDVEDFERRRGYISRVVSKALVAGGSQIADNAAYAAG